MKGKPPLPPAKPSGAGMMVNKNNGTAGKPCSNAIRDNRLMRMTMRAPRRG